PRPFLQGARLTAWELVRDGIQTTVITDNMAGALMRQQKVDLVVVGADRIAANGDTANKIGTYSVAVLAREHKIPFYVAAPLSTIDLDTPDGQHIPIEERNPREVTHVGGSQVAPAGAHIWNPAFDVTPHQYICGVVERALAEADTSWRGLGAVAVTQGPRLVGSLLVGVSFAKASAAAGGLPLVAVHHLAGHIESLVLQNGELPLPSVVLVVSG